MRHEGDLAASFKFRGQTSAIAVEIFKRLARQHKEFGKSNELADLERIFSSVTDLPLAIIYVEKLLQCPWIRRLWVVQELELASRAIVFHGSCMFSPDTLGRTVGCLLEAYGTTLTSYGVELDGPWGNILRMGFNHWGWLVTFNHYMDIQPGMCWETCSFRQAISCVRMF